jgi:hypothetical protein
VTVLELQRRTLTRLGDNPDADPTLMHYTPTEVLARLNECQRLFCLFTLCLETTATFALTGAAHYHMLDTFADWIVPLRIRNASGAKVRPARLADLATLDSEWSIKAGVPTRYAHTGFDLLSVYKQNTSNVPITYARSAVELVSSYPADNLVEPEIPTRYHPTLIDGAIVLARTKEGAQEWQKVLPQWDRFLSSATELADKVRARCREQGYDAAPVEINRYDQARFLNRKVG